MSESLRVLAAGLGGNQRVAALQQQLCHLVYGLIFRPGSWRWGDFAHFDWGSPAMEDSLQRDVQVPIPLGAGVKIRVIAIAKGLAGTHQHGHFPELSAMNGNRALQQSCASVKQHRLEPPGSPG